jgi:hypothetical protein
VYSKGEDGSIIMEKEKRKLKWIQKKRYIAQNKNNLQYMIFEGHQEIKPA